MMEWDEVAEGTSPPARPLRLEFMRLTPRVEPFHVRLLSLPIFFRKHWEAFRPIGQFPISPISVLRGDLTLGIDRAFDEGGFIPSKRFVVPVLDYEHGSEQVFLLEGSSSLFRQFGEFYQRTHVEPHDHVQAPSFNLRVEGGGSSRRTQITPMGLADRPYAGARLNILLNDYRATETYLRRSIYRSATSEEISEKWEQVQRQAPGHRYDPNRRGGPPPSPNSPAVITSMTGRMDPDVLENIIQSDMENASGVRAESQTEEDSRIFASINSSSFSERQAGMEAARARCERNRANPQAPIDMNGNIVLPVTDAEGNIVERQTISEAPEPEEPKGISDWDDNDWEKWLENMGEPSSELDQGILDDDEALI